MPKTTKVKQPLSIAQKENLLGKAPISLLLPWSCAHDRNCSKIDGCLVVSGDRKTIAEIRDAAGVDAADLAGLIVRAVNAYEKHLDLIDEMAIAIELCLECEGRLTWTAEHDAQVVVARAKQARTR